MHSRVAEANTEHETNKNGREYGSPAEISEDVTSTLTQGGYAFTVTGAELQPININLAPGTEFSKFRTCNLAWYPVPMLAVQCLYLHTMALL